MGSYCGDYCANRAQTKEDFLGILYSECGYKVPKLDALSIAFRFFFIFNLLK